MHIDIKNETLAAGIISQMKQKHEEAQEPEDLVGEEGQRCEFVSPSGQRCRNMARPDSRFCGVHEKMALVDDAEVSDDPDSLV